MNNDIKNEILVLECQQGNVDAFARLATAWHDRLISHAWRITGDHEAAKDLVQETWLTVMKKINQLSDVDTFPKWVFRILTNKCMDWVRRRTRFSTIKSILYINHQRRQTINTVPDRISTLREALEILPPKQRALVTLYYVEGFQTDEIAEMLGIPRGTIKSRLYTIRQKLRSIMERQAPK